MKEILKRIIKDFHITPLPDFKERDKKVFLNTGKIISIVGPRRSGKTYFMFQIMNELIKKKITKKKILYINFEDERLIFEDTGYDEIFFAYKELYPEINENELYIFFDEIQNLANWEKFVRRVYDSKTKNIFLTGSNIKILSKEIASSLRGRTITEEILPLSFKELLRFKDIESDLYSTNGISIINREFEQYLYWGGFPELIDFNKSLKLKILQEYFNVMIYRDLVEKHNIKDVYILKYLIKRLFSAFTKEFSVNKVYNEFKSRNFVISKNTLYEYIEYIIDNYIIAIVEKYEPSVVKQELSNKKVYLYDNGLIAGNYMSIEDNKGRFLENVIFTELYRRNYKVNFVKNNFECDFLLFQNQNQMSVPIQVCYRLDDDNKKREIKGLLKTLERFNLNKGVIITMGLEKEELVNNEKIAVIPVIKWLLGHNNNDI